MDLRALGRTVRQPWLGMYRWRALAWLTPAAPVRVLRPDGTEALWRGDRGRAAGGRAGASARFVAVEMPDEQVLRRDLRVPALAEADIHQALELQAMSLSPFPASDLVWGWRASPVKNGLREVQLALMSRRQVAEQLDRRLPDDQRRTPAEVWVCPDDAAPIVVQGFGEGVRVASARRQRHLGYWLLVLAALLCAAILATPTVQLWWRARQASFAHDALAVRARPVLARRDAMLQSVTELKTIQDLQGDRIDPLRVLDTVTKALPDGTALQSLRLQGGTVTISGLTADAASLMQTLSDGPGLSNVRAPTPATRIGNATTESFTISFALDPHIFGAEATVAAKASDPVAGGPTSASSPGPVAAPAAAASAPVAAASTPAAAVPAPAAAASAPAVARPAVPAAVPPAPAQSPVGLQPSFGGAAVGRQP